MESRSFKTFWVAFFLTITVLAPVVGGVVLWQRASGQHRQSVAQSQTGVPIRVPKTENRLQALVCVADGQQPAFVLLRLDAVAGQVRLLVLPGQTAVPFAGSEATLWQCYAAAGPARCVQALNEGLDAGIERYLALSPATLQTVADGFGPLRAGFSGVLTAAGLAACGLDGPVQEWGAGYAHEWLAGLEQAAAAGQADVPGPASLAGLRAVLWGAFFRQYLPQLPAALPAALRAASSATLTDITAQELLVLEDTLEFVATAAMQNGGEEGGVYSAVLPGQYDAAAGCYRPGEQAAAALQAWRSASAMGAQSAVGSAP